MTVKQDVIDICLNRGIPVVACENHSSGRLTCPQIIQNVDTLEEEDFENIYRRIAGIPWDIATTERCLIREYGADGDLDRLFNLYSKPGITDFMEGLFEYEKEREYQLNYINYIYKIYDFGMWLVFDKYTGELIGRAGIEVREDCIRDKEAELGFCISPDRWRQGLAYEVCSAIIGLARDDYELDSLIARCDPDNLGSIRLLEKLGFTFERMLKDGDCLYHMVL